MAKTKEMTLATALGLSVGIAIACSACLAGLFVVWYWTIGAVHPTWNNFAVVAARMNLTRVVLGAWLVVFVLLLPYLLMMAHRQETRID